MSNRYRMASDLQTALAISSLPLRSSVDPSTMIESALWKSAFWHIQLKDILKVVGILLVPLTLGAATLVLTNENTKQSNENRQKDLDIARRDREQTAYLAEEERQDNRLREYLNDISTLMHPNQTFSPILRAKTLNVIRQLDAKRKREVILFLYEAKLIRSNFNPRIPNISLEDVNLDNVDLSDLRPSYTQFLSNFYYDTQIALRGVSLRNTTFSRRNLYRSDLAQTDCTNSDFSSVDFLEVDLSYAKLVKCNFENARFDSANLQNANLSESNITDEQLTQTLTYQGAIFPNGTIAKNKNLLINNDCINNVTENLTSGHWILRNGSVVTRLLNENCYLASYDLELSIIHQKIDLFKYFPWIMRDRTVYRFNSSVFIDKDHNLSNYIVINIRKLSTNGTELDKQTICQQADSRFCDGNSKMCTNGICSFDDELDTIDGKSVYSVDIEIIFINIKKRFDPLTRFDDASAAAILHDIKFHVFVFEF